MPHVFASATDMDRQIQYINIHADIKMKPELYHNTLKARQKMDELQQRLEAVLLEYFDEVDGNEHMSNHEYNKAMGL